MMLPTTTIPTSAEDEPGVSPTLTLGSLTIDPLEVPLRPPLTFRALDRAQTTWKEQDLGLHVTTDRTPLDSTVCGHALLPALAAAVTREGEQSLQRMGAAVWSRIRAVSDTSTATGFIAGRAVSLQEFRTALRRYARRRGPDGS